MDSFKSPDSKKRSRLDEMMGTSHSKKKRGKVKRSPLRALKQPKDDDYSLRKQKAKGSKKYEEETKIYSRMGDDSMKFADEFGGSMTMLNTKSELSVKSTKTHKSPLGRGRGGRKKSPMNKHKMNLGKVKSF